MSNIAYDVNKLEKSANIDTKKGIENFYSKQEYFNKLAEFVSESGNYLKEYKPEIVISRDNVRKDILKEVHEVRTLLTVLGLSKMSLDLRFLESAIVKKDVASLITELAEFHEDMGKISKKINSARMDTPNPEPEEPEKQAIQEDVKPKTPPLILAVDDKPEILAAIVAMLEGSCTVIGVTSGAIALRVLEKHTPDYFLLDIQMPEMDGYELAKLIRYHKKFRYTPIVFLTSKNSRDSVLGAFKYGGTDYLLKPVEKELLLSKIWQYLK